MGTQLSLLILTLCAVIIIAVLLDKNKKLSQQKLQAHDPELALEVKRIIFSNTQMIRRS